MKEFILNTQLEKDSFLLSDLSLCQMRLFNNSNYPWLLLIPKINAASEIFDLTLEDQNTLQQEISTIASKLKQVTACDKINIGILGNMVAQLHVHIIARFKHDHCWPRAVWGSEMMTYADPQHAVHYWQEKLNVL